MLVSHLCWGAGALLLSACGEKDGVGGASASLRVWSALRPDRDLTSAEIMTFARLEAREAALLGT